MKPILDQVIAVAARTSANPRTRLEIEAEQLALSLPPLRATATLARASVDPGVHGHKRAGTGESFWQFRRFQEGDFRSDIDWRASARHEHLHVREREKEAPLRFRLWWSNAHTMSYRSKRKLPYKHERAAVLLLALARLLRRGGEKVETLEGEAENPLNRAPAESRASCLILAGDFLDVSDDLYEQMRPLASGNATGHLLHIIDPAEEKFPFQGRTGFTNAEGAVRQILGNAEDCTHEYQNRFTRHCDRIGKIARALGWSLQRHYTDETAQDALLQLHQRLSAPAGGMS
ncbi:MAG: DUF58 domain-containing protein [Hyphomicrobiales bacterium]|nr:DUF58 domain-containing protein [Hyphomicrobiales bacterium]MCY4038243.1 DUF58 domain-containing protein [Hyphomicrobiales bacterium]